MCLHILSASARARKTKARAQHLPGSEGKTVCGLWVKPEFFDNGGAACNSCQGVRDGRPRAKQWRRTTQG